MDTRTASPPDTHTVTSIIGDTKFDHESLSDKISAYYSLVFPNFTYYLQTLTVTIGRRCIPISTASSSEQPQVDVDLGPLKSVSRLHAKIEYEEEEERFMLVVLGRNGAWVDGTWSGKGSKVPLSERSQIQIASRTFHFVLPPPPAPEDSPSPSSQSSTNRPRSPSVDITSISPPSSLQSVSPPPAVAISPPPPKAPPLPEPPRLPNSNSLGKGKQQPKKRKASDVEPQPRPKPDVMPPKPQFTYAQLCYRAIKALGGKATLQDIISWMIENYDWYRYNEKTGWEKSVRHNLSSNRAFRKMERSAGERGKGFYWAVEEDCEHVFEEQEAKALAGASGSGKDSKQGGKKPKGGASLLEPPLKRSVRGEAKGAPLPPPLTSTPLAFKSVTPAATFSAPSSTSCTPVVKMEPSAAPPIPPAPKPQASGIAPIASTFTASPPPSPQLPAPATASPDASSNVISPSGIPPIPASVILPIIVGPVPASHPSASTSSASSNTTTPHLSTPPIVLHENQLILNPAIFSHLTPAQLRELEALGAQKALEILHGHIVRFLKERIKTEAARGRGRGRGKRALGRGGKEGGGAGGEGREGKKEKVPISGLFTTTPLPLRKPQQFTPAPTPTPAPPQAAPMASLSAEQPTDGPPSPILVVDDDPPEGPMPKRRRIETPELPMVGG
ncbi:hypothetical protein EW146_g7244 [Bondarzewia mesenterica]|uniref:Fork-head domain-containing protein n=1 Tax=Bondarzewia mesenterica TaxID=1095465 RepID=A0A4V3XEB1_9AGAM|nr:hypothetical protein EW146_g7244 [Bondarzewia mesenterica]